MSYEPTIWECGDVVTAERLNHMEEGIQTANDCCGSGLEPYVITIIGDYECPNEEVNAKGETKGILHYYEYSCTYEELLQVATDHRPIFFVPPTDEPSRAIGYHILYLPIVYMDLVENFNEYSVEFAFITWDIDNGFYTENKHLYSDTPEVHMVDVSCGGGR